MEMYRIDRIRKQQQARLDYQDRKWKASWRGRTTKSLITYLWIFIPLLFCVGLWEDMANNRSPRRGWWKNTLGIPDFNDWFMFEVVNAAKKMGKDGKKKQKSEPEKVRGEPPAEGDAQEAPQNKTLSEEEMIKLELAKEEEELGIDGDGSGIEDYDDEDEEFEVEGDEDELNDVDFTDEKLSGKMQGYYKGLEPMFYRDKKHAASISFKRFMRTHIRYYLPGVFHQLLEGQPAL